MAGALYMDAVITPNRSLSQAGFRWLIGLVALAYLAMAGVMILLKAFPVPFFLGFAIVAVFVAFRASYRSARLAERVQVSAVEVRVLQEAGRTSRTIWRSPTAFTRVAVERPGEPEARIRLCLSDRALTVAHALSPLERIRFGEALERAIQAARAERC